MVDSKMSELTHILFPRDLKVWSNLFRKATGVHLILMGGFCAHSCFHIREKVRERERERKVKDKMMIFCSLLRRERERTVMASGKGGRNNLSKSSLKARA